ncbi:MAG: ATP-grasp domain-containing protein [Proteobacteria bacterium]|nr:ATP-grasp domain-containing protein [Pseudomonadota bacterium]
MDRLPATLAAHGVGCAILAPPGFYCTASRAIQRHFRLPPHCGMWLGITFLRPLLESAAREWQADLIIPLDDVAARCLRGLVSTPATSAALRAVLQTSLGAPSGYADSCSRSGLMQLAERLGVRVPRFTVTPDPAKRLEQAASWGYPVVLKVEHTCGGHGVTIATTPEQLAASVAAAAGAPLWLRMKHRLRNRVWRLTGREETAKAPPLVQSFVQGVPAMRTVSAWQGAVLDGISFVADKTHPAPTGPSTIVRHVENDEMADSARRLVAALGCSGFVSFDFMLNEATGEAALIEMNPRPIGTTHLAALFGHDACVPLLARLTGGRFAEHVAAAAHPQQVALFPKEIERDRRDLGRLCSPGIYHDMPIDQPRIMALYLRRLQKLYPAEFPEIVEGLHALGAHLPLPASGNQQLAESSPRPALRSWIDRLSDGQPPGLPRL